MLEPVVRLRDRVRAEGVRLDHVGAGFEEVVVDLSDHVGPGHREQLVVALELAGVVREMRAAEILFLEAEALDHRAHRTVEHEDPLAQGALELFKAFGARRTVGHVGISLRARGRARQRSSLESIHPHIQIYE